tara:strand:+ start:1525 stop:1794 length:270 start_codon:yes stop_codon:yes gene_type:complete
LGYKLYRFSIIILQIEESIESCLDILDERYKSMTKIIEKPVFFDSVEVRQVISNIKESRVAILDVANRLTNDMEMLNEIEEKSNKKKDT